VEASAKLSVPRKLIFWNRFPTWQLVPLIPS